MENFTQFLSTVDHRTTLEGGLEEPAPPYSQKSTYNFDSPKTH